MTAGVLINTILRPLSVVLTLACLTFSLSSHAANSNLDDRILAIDSGKSPPFTLLAIETLVPMKSRQFDSPSLRVMGVYGLDPLSYEENATKGSVPLVAETPQGLLQTVKTLGAGYDHESGNLNSTSLVVAQDAGNITPMEESILDDKDVPPLDASQIPAGADDSKTQLWHDLNNLADASATCANDTSNCCNKSCNHKHDTCTGDNCAAQDTQDTECTGDNCTADEASCTDDSCQTEDDCCDCCCSEDVGGPLGSGYFGYGAGGGGFGGGFGGGGAGSSARSNTKSHDKPPPTPVPEPSTYLILAGAALVVAVVRRKQIQKKDS